jgi:WD40 repeat protein
MGGGIGRLEMYKTTNILALVGGGKNPKYPLNKIIIWDDNKRKVVGEIRLNSMVLNVKLKMDRIIGVCEKKIYIFNFITFGIMNIFDSYENTNGIVGFSSGDMISILAFPFENKGIIKLVNFNSTSQLPIITAHESKIACLSISKNGQLLASASDKGTLIRVFNVFKGDLVVELRRGSTSAEIRYISFDEDNKYVGCASGVGTIHIFSLKNNSKEDDSSEINEEEPKNQKRILGRFSFLNKLNSSINSERSFAKFRVNEQNNIFTFFGVNKIFVLTSDGKYYIATFDPKKPGDCDKKKEMNIFDTNK